MPLGVGRVVGGHLTWGQGGLEVLSFDIHQITNWCVDALNVQPTPHFADLRLLRLRVGIRPSPPSDSASDSSQHRLLPASPSRNDWLARLPRILDENVHNLQQPWSKFGRDVRHVPRTGQILLHCTRWQKPCSYWEKFAPEASALHWDMASSCAHLALQLKGASSPSKEVVFQSNHDFPESIAQCLHYQTGRLRRTRFPRNGT